MKTDWLAVLVTTAAIACAARTTCADEPSRAVDAGRLRPGTRVEIRAAAVVDLPEVVTMRLARGSFETATPGRIVAQTRDTLSVCPPGCTAPVAVIRPATKVKAVVLAVESDVMRLALEGESDMVALLPVAAIADVRMMETDGPPHASAAGLVGRRVAVEVGNVVEIPNETEDAGSRSAQDVVINGTPLTEVHAAGQETPLLVPSPRSHLEGNVAAADGDAITVRLLGGAQLVTVPRAAIASLRVQHRRSWAGRGALIGAGIGLAATLGLVVYSEVGHPGSCAGEDGGLCNVIYAASAVVTTSGGAIVGAVAGAMTHTDHWERIDTRRWQVTVAPDLRGGVRGRLALRF
jgi:hypothetical protein